MKIVVHQAGLEEIKRSPEVAEMLGGVADGVAQGVNAPSTVEVSTRHGVGRRGAFAQVVMTGSGALAIEFGSRHNPPLAPLRNALRRAR